MTTEKITLHNAVGRFIDEQGTPCVVFAVAGQELRFPEKGTRWWEDGAVGQLTRDIENGSYTFWPYPDQRLRRAPEYDIQEPFVNLWGWTFQEANGILRAFTAKGGVVPGLEGRILDDETQPVEIDVPPEFFEFCEENGTTVEDVLRGFIADLCGLESTHALPRADNYNDHGSDERDMAKEYFVRTWRGRTFF